MDRFFKNNIWLKLTALFTAAAVIFSSAAYSAVYNLPEPATLVKASLNYSYPLLKGLRFDPADPLRMEFIIDTASKGEVGQEEAQLLVSYFLAGLTMPEDKLWVNLSPYEKERVIPEDLALTDLGKDMLAQDYILKQFAASLSDPDSNNGKDYWRALFSAVAKKYGTTNVPIDTFNKIWLMPKKCVVRETANAAFVSEATLKAVLDSDRLAGAHSGAKDAEISAQITREKILPLVEQEVNSGKSFARLRQIYYALALSVWFKEKFQQSLYKHYIDQAKIKGIDLSDKSVKENIFNLYVEAFKKGAYNYVRRDFDRARMRYTKRQYYSGGISVPARKDVLILPAGPEFNPAYLTGDYRAIEVALNVYSDNGIDSQLADAYAAQDKPVQVDPGSVEKAIVALESLGEVGKRISERLRQCPSINLVSGIAHSHAGGRGIHIAEKGGLSPAAREAYIQEQLVHEAIAGTIFGHSGRVYNLAVGVTNALARGDRAQAAELLGNLPAELKLSDKALWQMSPGERALVIRDFAAYGGDIESFTINPDIYTDRRHYIFTVAQTTQALLGAMDQEQLSKLLKASFLPSHPDPFADRSKELAGVKLFGEIEISSVEDLNGKDGKAYAVKLVVLDESGNGHRDLWFGLSEVPASRQGIVKWALEADHANKKGIKFGRYYRDQKGKLWQVSPLSATKEGLAAPEQPKYTIEFYRGGRDVMADDLFDALDPKAKQKVVDLLIALEQNGPLRVGGQNAKQLQEAGGIRELRFKSDNNNVQRRLLYFAYGSRIVVLNGFGKQNGHDDAAVTRARNAKNDYETREKSLQAATSAAMGRWQWERTELIGDQLILHGATRLPGEDGVVDPAFLTADGKNLPRDIVLTLRPLTAEERAKVSLPEGYTGEVRVIVRDDVSVKNRIYGIAAKDGNGLPAEGLPCVREDILKRGNAAQVKEAVKHEVDELAPGAEHEKILATQDDHGLTDLIQTISREDKELGGISFNKRDFALETQKDAALNQKLSQNDELDFSRLTFRVAAIKPITADAIVTRFLDRAR